MTNAFQGKDDHLARLDRRFYQGTAYVHWTLTIDNRRTGWLVPVFYYKFREILTHAAFRYSIACPIFCLMPDHMHLLWMGIHEWSDQLNAMPFVRKHVKEMLLKLGFELQHQPYDHVLKDEERLESDFENLVEYIARNPERKQLVPRDGFRDYKYTGCLVPGYPELKPGASDYWTRFWRTYSYLRLNGLDRRAKMDETPP